MLYEFALDPEVLSTWQSFRYFIDRFGVQHGRMISRFPKKWKRMVYDATLGCATIERKRIEEILKDRVDGKLLVTNRAYNGELAWLVNAEEAHRLQPFHAIISRTNPRGAAAVLLADDLDETSEANPLWISNRTKRVTRKAQDLTDTVAPLLSCSSQLILIDPYFNPNELRFRNVLKSLVREICFKGAPRRLEYHLRADYSTAPSTAFFQEAVQRRLPQILPAGIELKIVRWNQRTGGREFHARHLLTELGGLMLDPGLDEGEDGEMTTIALIEIESHTMLLEDFPADANKGTTYEFADEITVVGTAR